MRPLPRRGLRRVAVLLLVAWLAGTLATPQERDDAPEATPKESDSDAATEDSNKPPKEIGLVERAERGLAQIDVTVRGPWGTISDLDASDFDLVIRGKRIEKLFVDRLCRPPDQATKASVQAASDEPGDVHSGEATPPVPRRIASFLFYFDQRMMTMQGRANAISSARKMVRELIEDGNRAVLISAGKRLRTVVPLTDDVDELIGALNRLEGDHEQFVPYAQQEQDRINQLLDEMRVSSLHACKLASLLQREELSYTEKSLRLFSLTMSHMAELDPPKVVFYFADIMRQKAGMHYFSYVGGCADGGTESQLGGFDAAHAIDDVIAEAATHGTRVYTIRPEGLVTGVTASQRFGIGSINRNATNLASTNLQRISHAGDSLTGMALETGGQSFIYGEGPSKIVQTVEADLGCIYLLSFDPAGLPLDQPLRVLVRVNRPKVKVQSQGRTVFQSVSAERTSKLMAAFVASGPGRSDTPVEAVVIPTGFAGGRFTGLVQMRVPGSPLNEAEWHLGTSLVSGGDFAGDDSGQISVNRANVPVVFETEMRFRPGPFELIFVAHEMKTDQLGRHRLEGGWPERADGPAVGPIAVIQPGDGAFLRDGETRRRGAMGLGEESFLQSELPTALVALVCRGASKLNQVQVRRTLIGEGETDFPEMQIELTDERCAQIRDMIPAATLTEGRFTYRVQLVQGEEQLATRDYTFSAINESTVRPAAAVADTDSP